MKSQLPFQECTLSPFFKWFSWEGCADIQDRNNTVYTKLSHFLFHYRLKPHTTTGVAPAELMLRQHRFHNNNNDKSHNIAEPLDNTHFNQMTWWWFKGPKHNCLPGVVVSNNGEQSYNIKLSKDKIVRRHVDHIRHRQTDCILDPEDNTVDIPIPIVTC